MSKEQLMQAGFTEEQATKILALYKADIDANYVPKHRFDEVNSELKTTKGLVADRDKQIKDLKKFEGTNQELQDKIKELEETNRNADTQHQETLKAERKKNAVRLVLLEDEKNRPFDTEMVLGLVDLTKVELGEDGKIVSGFKEQHDSLKKEKQFLFRTVKEPDNNPQGINFRGNTPPDGDPNNPSGNNPTDYGKSLASVKLGMMGITPVDNSSNNN